MAIYLKKFETTSQYNAYTADTANFIIPNVSLITDTNTVAYNPDNIRPITNAVITCDSATYNGQTQVATNIVVTLNDSTLVSGTDYTVSGNEGGINTGDYTFTIDGIGNYKGSKNGTFTINKVTPTVVIPVAKVLTYQRDVAQELVTAGSTNFGTMKYSTDGETYSASVPSKTKAGSYTVYYFVEGDSNVNSTEVATVACSINEKPVTATIELSQDTYTYDGTAKEPPVTVKDGGDVIDPSEYSVTYSNNTNAGTASVTITDNTAGDYNVSGVTTFTINKANQSAPIATSATTTYNTTATATASGGGSQGSLEWESAQSQTSVGSHTTRARWSGNSNYNASPWSNSVTVQMNKASRTISWSTNPNKVYVGNNITVSATPSLGVGDGTITYSSSDTTKATVNGNTVSGISLGSCTITATISEGMNYLSASTSYTLNVLHDYSKDYLTFVARESGTFSFIGTGGTSGQYGDFYITPTDRESISYSLDNGGTWTTVTNTNVFNGTVLTTPTVQAGDKVLWKGIGTRNAKSSPFGHPENVSCKFTSTGTFDIEGNIMSIMYGDNFIGQQSLTTLYACGCLFNKNTKIVSAANLSLPATTLANNCYFNMFYNCSSLTTAPSELPATTLANSCYTAMFQNCTSLTTAPELPATTLAEGCYSNMFSGCTKLNYIKAMFTTTPGGSYTNYWVYNVARTGTFVKNRAATWTTIGDSGIPSGWTVQTASS